MNINWYALGVSTEQQGRMPDVRSFPRNLNPAAKKYWEQAVAVNKERNTQRAWTSVFKSFLALCSTAGVYPYDNRSTDNDRIYKTLIDARRAVVRFIEKEALNTEVIVRTTERRVRTTSTGFVLTCNGHCDVLPEPPKAIANMGLRTMRNPWGYGSAWTVGLDQGLTFFVANDYVNMTGRWHYGYELVCPVFPHIPGSGAPSSAEIEKFILDVLYLPILRAYRPLGLQHRLV